MGDSAQDQGKETTQLTEGGKAERAERLRLPGNSVSYLK